MSVLKRYMFKDEAREVADRLKDYAESEAEMLRKTADRLHVAGVGPEIVDYVADVAGRLDGLVEDL